MYNTSVLHSVLGWHVDGMTTVKESPRTNLTESWDDVWHSIIGHPHSGYLVKHK